MRRSWLPHLFIGLMIALMSAPLIVTVGVSLNEKRALFFPPRGISLAWYGQLFMDPTWLSALATSFSVSLLAALLAVAIALPVAYFLWRHNLVYARYLFVIGLMPFALPPVITAIGALSFWAQIGWSGRLENLVIGHAILMVSLPLVMISLGLRGIGREVLEAAQVMGANERVAFRTVVLPLIRSYIFSSFAFVFILSMNEYVLSFFLGQFKTITLPVKIVTQLRSGYSPIIAVSAVFFMMLGIAVFSLIARFGNLPKLLGAR